MLTFALVGTRIGRKVKNKNFSKFTKRQTHKRRGKEAAKAELLRALSEVGVSYGGAKLGIVNDSGRAARKSAKQRSDDNFVRGVFSASRQGYGFVTPEGGGEDIFVSAGKTHGALDGDLVEVIYTEYISGGTLRTDGRIARVVEKGLHTLYGRLEEEIAVIGRRRRRYFVLIPDNRSLPYRPEVTELGGAQLGDKVECEIIRDGRFGISCKVIESFGPADSLYANYGAILREEGIMTEFSDDELYEAEKVASEKVSTEGREDRRDEVIFTMDGRGAKDLDDAVSVRRLPHGGYRLGVYIADVSHYVRERTALDRTVMARGTSVYFTDKVVPMLPTALSNGACSLNAGEDKYSLGAIVDLDREGNIKGLHLSECVIRSRVRGVYSEVNAVLDGTADGEIKKKYAPVKDQLSKMDELYSLLAEKRKKRGAVDFDTPEAELILGEDGRVVDVVRRERGRAERIIEEFMLTANEAVATHLFNEKIPCVYRIHEAPPEDKLSDFVDYVHALGFDAKVINKEMKEPSDFARLLSVAEERGLSEPVSYNMLRAMSKAKYSENHHSHFGLAIDKYCHFTSPIRRLSDLAVHRIIKRVIKDGKRAELYTGYARRAAAAATEGEMRAVSAERRIDNLYKALYMADHIGEEFSAAVGSVTKHGLFVMLENTVEGLIPISDLPGYCIFDEKTLSIRGRGRLYRTADRLTVRLEESDIETGKLRFSLVLTEE